MTRYADQITDQHGTALSGAKVYVYDQNESLATLAEDGGGALANPVTSDQYGNFHFNAADGLYSLAYHYGGKQILRDEAVQIGVGLPLPDAILDQFALPNSGNLYNYTRTGTAPTTEPIQVVLDRTPFFPEMRGYDAAFLADGHGQAAFDRMNADIAADGKGALVSLEKGKQYIAGKQTPGLNGLYQGEGSMITATGVPFLIVEGNGATLKFKNGLKFGGFNPTTGLPQDSVGGDPTKLANVGYAVMAENVDFFVVRNLSIDCNSTGLVLGGLFGDASGRQCIHYGVAAYACGNTLWDAIEVENSGLDGFLYAWAGLTTADPAKPFLMQRCKSKRSARNNISIVGGNSITLVNSDFERPGDAPNTASGAFGSNPKSSCDIEAESSIIRNVLILNPRHTINDLGHNSLDTVGDVRHVTVIGGLLGGGTYTPNAHVKFKNVQIYNGIGQFFAGSTNPLENTLFEDCLITDQVYSPATTLVRPVVNGSASSGTASSMAKAIRCQFTITGGQAGFNFLDVRDSEVYVATGTPNLASGSLVANITSAKFARTDFYDRAGTAAGTAAPASPYYVDGVNMADMAATQIIAGGGNKLRWGSAAGYTGLYSWRQGSATWDPASIAAGASATTDVSVTGAALGDQAFASFSLALGGLILTSAVQSANTIRVTLSNPTGGAIDLASGTVRAWFVPKQQ